MKTIGLFPLFFLYSLAANSPALAQGTVTFQNSVVFQTIDPSGGEHLIYELGAVSFIPGPTGNGLRGTQWVAELYSGTDAGSLAPVTASISRFRSSTTPNRGKWAVSTIYGASNDGMVIAGSIPGQIVFLQVAMWDFREATVYEGANIRGKSTVFTYKIPGTSDPPAAYYMENFQAFAILSPEPSVIALALVSLVGVAIWEGGRRRIRRAVPNQVDNSG